MFILKKNKQSWVSNPELLFHWVRDALYPLYCLLLRRGLIFSRKLVMSPSEHVSGVGPTAAFSLEKGQIPRIFPKIKP